MKKSFPVVAAGLLSGQAVLHTVGAQEKAVPAPNHLLAVQTSPTEITLVWRGNSKATEHLVSDPGRRPISLGIEAIDGKAATPEVTISIDPNKAAVDTTGGKGAVAGPAAKGPTNVKADLISPNTVRLTWTALPGATYEIRRSIGSAIGQVIAGIASAVSQYVDQLPPLPGGKDNTLFYRIGIANDKRVAPVTVTIDPLKGTSETIEDQGLDSLPRGRGKVP